MGTSGLLSECYFPNLRARSRHPGFFKTERFADRARLDFYGAFVAVVVLLSVVSALNSSRAVPAWPLSHGSNSFSWRRLRQEMYPAGLL